MAFSICRLVPDTRVQSHAHSVCGRVAIAPYACPGTAELGEKIAATFANQPIARDGDAEDDVQVSASRLRTLMPLLRVTAGATHTRGCLSAPTPDDTDVAFLLTPSRRT